MVIKYLKTLRQRFSIVVASGLAGLTIPILMLITESILISFNVNYDPLIESISALGWKPLGWVQSVSFLVIGLLIEIFALGFYLSVRRKTGFGIGTAFLVLFGFGTLLIGAFREQPIGAPMTTESTIHVVGASMNFALFPLACFSFVFSLKSDPNWQALFIYTIVAGLIAIVVGVILWLSQTVCWFGLCERILVANSVIWLQVMSVRLLILSFRKPIMISDSPS